jgi:hypothetical protein
VAAPALPAEKSAIAEFSLPYIVAKDLLITPIYQFSISGQ